MSAAMLALIREEKGKIRYSIALLAVILRKEIKRVTQRVTPTNIF